MNINLFLIRCKLALLDEESIEGACQISQGANFWLSGDGELTIARDARFIELGEDQTRRVLNLFGLVGSHQSTCLEASKVDQVLFKMLKSISDNHLNFCTQKDNNYERSEIY